MKLVSVNYHLFADLFGTIFVFFLPLFATRSKRATSTLGRCNIMNIAEIKKVIKENPRVILYFGSDWDSFVAAVKATGGFIPGRTNNYTELCLLYANGKYDGFNRENSIEFFRMDFTAKKAYYARCTFAGLEKDGEWLLVDLSRNRKARVI